MVSQSKARDPRFWERWRHSGAIGVIPAGRVTTLVSEEELMRRCKKEGIVFAKVQTCVPRWAESAPRKKGVKSALVHCDLIIRSDGSAVFLDGMMGMESISVASGHCRGKANPENLEWEEYVKSLTSLPEVK